MSRYQVQMGVEMTPVVKKLIIINVTVWFVAVLIGQQFLMDRPYVFQWFGLVPAEMLNHFFIWQPVTYMFLHSTSIFHIVFNMLSLWWLGADLEQRWGGRFFLVYYMVCGVGAAAIYLLGTLIYFVITRDALPLQIPVVGASGAIFGVILAYGMIFGERMMYFMMLFPMKAKYFVTLLALIEVFSLLSSGFGSQVANLAHLGGFVAGFLFLLFYTKRKASNVRKQTKRHGRRLKLVVDNERKKDGGKGPKYWN